jgi:alpha-glucosidase
MNDYKWWERGVVYQIYPRSFQDTNGDGIGDLQGIINRLDYLNNGTRRSLGIDAIWISPFYPSPMADFGYDVANYTDVAPMFGDLETFDRLIEAAHQRNIKVIVDYVPNHSSDEHPWFTESRSSRDNPKSDWYIWRDPAPDGGYPNNWGAVFGGPAWTWDETRQQYYFHQFHPKQPDLNWQNSDLRLAMYNVLRFWMERGVDGFRMDVVHMIGKHPDMPDQPERTDLPVRGDMDLYNIQQQIYSMDYEGVHERMREIRRILNEHGALGIGEIWLPMDKWLRYYGEQDDELHMPFNFALISEGDFDNNTPWQADVIREIVNRYDGAAPPHGVPNWVLDNHDVPRLATRVGLAQARVAAVLLLTLRGTPTLFMGQEIGMVDGDIASDMVQDPQGINLGVEFTRDGTRTPMQWSGTDYAGFSTVDPWLPVNRDYLTCHVSRQLLDSTSMLSLYRTLIWTRKDSLALVAGGYESIDSPDGTFVYLRRWDDETKLVALNFTDEPKTITFEGGGEVIIDTGLARAGEAVSGRVRLAADEGVVIDLTA